MSASKPKPTQLGQRIVATSFYLWQNMERCGHKFYYGTSSFSRPLSLWYSSTNCL